MQLGIEVKIGYENPGIRVRAEAMKKSILAICEFYCILMRFFWNLLIKLWSP